MPGLTPGASKSELGSPWRQQVNSGGEGEKSGSSSPAKGNFWEQMDRALVHLDFPERQELLMKLRSALLLFGPVGQILQTHQHMSFRYKLIAPFEHGSHCQLPSRRTKNRYLSMSLPDAPPFRTDASSKLSLRSSRALTSPDAGRRFRRRVRWQGLEQAGAVAGGGRTLLSLFLLQ